ncbi:AbiTii domain-containing protein [Tenacibaculum aestuarii]|uniref:AbiTii domain-containing protein n=1 Tax=Tenacibaculum aestuarii TaxID=362781 RepID=UPI003894826C
MESKNKHILKLATEIMDDIELTKNEAQSILLKTTRLARYVDDSKVRDWLKFEMQGYPDSELSRIYMTKTGRWTNKKESKGYWFPLSQIEAKIQIETLKLNQLRIPDTSAEMALPIIKDIRLSINETAIRIAKLGGIKSRVISLVHEFVTNVYYERTFDQLAESIFDNYKNDIDLLLAENSGDVIEQIPSVFARLSENDKESISQALTTCRRIIDNFANKVFPPTIETINIGGNDLSLNENNVLNRINAYVHQHCESKNRKKKIRQNLSNLYSRVSAGVHDDVDSKEAKNLFLNVYLLLGEILTLKNN